VFRSVGYRGVAPVGRAVHESWDVILNDTRPVLVPPHQGAAGGEYTAGWIQARPTGVIAQPTSGAAETVELLFEDLPGRVLEPRTKRSRPTRSSAAVQPSFVSYNDWLKPDALEVAARAAAQGRRAVEDSRASRRCWPRSAR